MPKEAAVSVKGTMFWNGGYGMESVFWGGILQNTTFIKTTTSKTTIIPTQNPILIPQKDVVPNKFIQNIVQFIANTSPIYSNSP